MIPYPIEEMRKFIVEKYPNNHNTNHPDYTAGALMSAILRWWDDEMQAEIHKKDQEIEQLRDANIWWEHEARRMTDAKLVFESENVRLNEDNGFLLGRIKDLEQQLAEQHAYIGRLESRFLELAEADLWDSTYNADGATAHIARNKRAAKEALEKLKG